LAGLYQAPVAIIPFGHTARSAICRPPSTATSEKPNFLAPSGPTKGPGTYSCSNYPNHGRLAANKTTALGRLEENCYQRYERLKQITQGNPGRYSSSGGTRAQQVSFNFTITCGPAIKNDAQGQGHKRFWDCANARRTTSQGLDELLASQGRETDGRDNVSPQRRRDLRV
jgi:hypothetical protein